MCFSARKPPPSAKRRFGGRVGGWRPKTSLEGQLAAEGDGVEILAYVQAGRVQADMELDE
jgi:hypothetical protein